MRLNNKNAQPFFFCSAKNNYAKKNQSFKLFKLASITLTKESGDILLNITFCF